MELANYKNCRKQAREVKNSQEGICHEKQYFISEPAESRSIFVIHEKQPVRSKTATGESAAVTIRTIHSEIRNRINYLFECGKSGTAVVSGGG